MKRKIQLLLLFSLVVVASYAQKNQTAALTIGDAAPSLRVGEWIKGTPVQSFKKDKVYIVDFWATWCKPCLAAASRLPDLINKYKDKVSVIYIDIHERNTTPIERIKAMADSIPGGTNFSIAIEDSNYVETDWLDAFDERRYGIPRTFVINADGKVAWVGHPAFGLETALDKIINNTWDLKKALTKRNSDRRLMALDESTMRKLNPYMANSLKMDSALLIINNLIKKEPKLKYAPELGHYTFVSLLNSNQYKAYEFGKEMMITATYTEPAYDDIVRDIRWFSKKSKLLAKLYQLGAEAYQAQINHYPYPELVHNIPNQYHEMAGWYWSANDKSKAIVAEGKAIETFKNYPNLPESDLTNYEQKLQLYKGK